MVESNNNLSGSPEQGRVTTPPSQGIAAPSSGVGADTDTYDPLSQANPKARAYSRSTNANDLTDIPEPNFNTNRGPTEVPDWEHEAQQQSGGAGPSGGPAATGAATTPDDRFSDVRDLPPGKKRKSAQAFAKILVDGYGKYVPMLFKWMAKYPDDKLFELSSKRKLDFGIQFEFPDRTVKNVYEFIQSVNNQIEVGFEVTDEWKREILPYVIEELRSRGWGTTPMQTILWMVGEDIAMKSVSAMVINRQIGSFIEFAIEETKRRTGGGHTSSAQPAQEEPAPPPPPDTSASAKEQTSPPAPGETSATEGEEQILTPTVEVIPPGTED